MSPFVWLLLAACLSLARAQCGVAPPADFSFLLNGANLLWPCPSTQRIYVSSGRYVPKNVIATRVQLWRDEAFVAMPRYKPGVPITLAKLSLRHGDCRPLLSPYPAWALQEEGNCQALQNVVDIFLDPNDILWALDVGIVNTLETPIRRCPPKVVATNVRTSQVVSVVDLSELVTLNSRLQYLAVDYAPDGRPFVYISDAASRAILVYDVVHNKGYRVVLPQAVTSGCVGRDVLYIALIRKPCGATVLVFTYLSGTRVYAIKTENLRRGCARGTITDIGPKPGPIVLLGTDGGGALFFRKKSQSDIYMWNTGTPFKPENFLLVQRGGDCRLATQVVPGFRRVMWVLESNFHDFILGTVGCIGASVALKPLVQAVE